MRDARRYSEVKGLGRKMGTHTVAGPDLIESLRQLCEVGMITLQYR